MNVLKPDITPTRYTWEIYLTEKCSYDCRYCTVHTPNIKFNKIDFDNLFSQDISKDANIYIFGGEPMIHPQIWKLLDRLKGYESVTIQSNMSSSISKLSRLDDYENIYLQASYHHKECDVMEFMHRCNSVKCLKDIAVMWTSEYDREIYMLYRVMMNKFNCDVWLEPTLPWTYNSVDWGDKKELKAFVKKYHPRLTKNFNEMVTVDGNRKTVMQSYIDNDDQKTKGIKCGVVKYTKTYDAHLNMWRSCTSDCMFKVDNPPVNEYYKICANNFCLLDLFYEKQR